MKKSPKKLLFERMHSIGGMPLKENEKYFQTKLPDDVKRLSNKYEGNRVIWYGDPDQMIVVHKDQVHGMYGNVYDSQKLQYVVDMIQNVENFDKVEFECSYGLGDVISLDNVMEEQEAYMGGRFESDYMELDEPHTTGDENLDQYLGSEYFDDIDDFYEIDDDNLRFLERYKTLIANGNMSPDAIQQEMTNKLGNIEGLNQFLQFEQELKNSVQNKEGDLGKFEVQLRDGHHRVMGAIKAGEEYVCVNLAKDQLGRFQNYITRVTTK